MPVFGVSDGQKKTPPSAPVIETQLDDGADRVLDDGASLVTFKESTYSGKLPITGYVITATSTDGLSVVASSVTSLTSFTLTGLKSGKSYKYKVKARNQVYDSAESNEIGPTIATTKPGTPTSVGAVNLNDGGGATLSWIAPVDGGSPIVKYTITPSSGATIDTTKTSYSFTGLALNSSYTYTVTAYNTNGAGTTSTPSNQITITKPTPVPVPVPVPVPAPSGPSVSGVSVYSVGTTTCTVTWSMGGMGSWYVSIGPWSSGLQNAVGGSTPPFTATGLTAGGSYTATVTVWSGYNSTGTSASASSGSFTMQGSTPVPVPVPIDPVPVPVPATTYCASSGSYVLSSGYPGNCAGAYVPTPTVNCSTPTSTSSGILGAASQCSSGLGYYDVTYYNSACAPNNTKSLTACYSVAPVPVPVPIPVPIPVPVYPTPTPTAPSRPWPCYYYSGNPGGAPSLPPPTGGYCLDIHSLIPTPHGNVELANLNVGDEVISAKFKEIDAFDPNADLIVDTWSTDALTYESLETTTITNIREFKEVGVYVINNRIRVTASHPFIAQDSEDGRFYYTRAGSLVIGDKLFDGNTETWTAIATIEYYPTEKMTVRTLSTEPYDMFFAQGILVHNK